MPQPGSPLIQQIHNGQLRLVLATTGGGASAISTLLGQSGASRSILAAAVPYSLAALTEWLGGKPDEACSPRTARAMAMSAYFKAGNYDPQATAGGVACTASLASDRPKRGAHRAHVAWQTATTTAAYHLELRKGRRTRAEEEALVSTLVLNAVAEACGVTARLPLELIEGEEVETARVVAPREQQELLAGQTLAVPVLAAGDNATPPALFPGAFHPLHPGHRKMAQIAQAILGKPVAFELSVANVDKPPLDFIEIDHRVKQFTPSEALWLTRAPTFEKKAALFPGATFVVGADTIARVGHERYYGGHPSAMQAAFDYLAAERCRFLVFGRAIDGAFRTLDELQLPPALGRLCTGVPEAAFREDISSTQLRQVQAREA